MIFRSGTCVVGVKTPTGVLLGADSAVSDGDLTIRTRTSKLIRKGKATVVFGVAGYLRDITLLRSGLELPAFDSGSPERYVERVMVPALRFLIEDVEQGAGITINGEHSDWVAEILVGVGGELITIDPRMGVLRWGDYAAIGSGQQYALGALHDKSGDPRSRVKRALEAAGEWARGHVAPPWRFMSV